MLRSYGLIFLFFFLSVTIGMVFLLLKPSKPSGDKTVKERTLPQGQNLSSPSRLPRPRDGGQGAKGAPHSPSPLKTLLPPLAPNGSTVHGIGRRGPRPPAAILFPDGTWLLPINGVKKAPPFPGFPPGRPYAPIVSIYRDPATGLSWYVHSDGSKSNVQRVRRQEGSKIWYEAGWVIGTPTATKGFPEKQGSGSGSNAGSSSGGK